MLLHIAALCNHASLAQEDGWKVIGDPTEGALLWGCPSLISHFRV
jgi:magnesium-transporting ATPase (P-type)